MIIRKCSETVNCSFPFSRRPRDEMRQFSLYSISEYEMKFKQNSPCYEKKLNVTRTASSLSLPAANSMVL